MDLDSIVHDYISWIFSGIGIVASGWLITFMKKKNPPPLTPHHEHRIGKESEPIIRKEVKGLSLTSKLYCVTFKRNKSPVYPWIEHKKIKVYTNHDVFSVGKDIILQHLDKEDDPYKFCLIVKIDERQEFQVNLLNAECIITGTGEPDDDGDMWRIWFLVDKEPVHPETRSPKYLNHSLY